MLSDSELDHPMVHCFKRRELLANEDRYRLAIAQRYSYVLPERGVLEAVRRYSPLIELGAGTGYWSYLLRAMGADVIAYDQAPAGSTRENRYHLQFRRWTEVLEGGVEVVERHPDRSLFLCWPPKYSSLWESVRLFSGRFVLVIGDGGSKTFRADWMTERFTLVEVHPAAALDPAPATDVVLSVWRRRDV